MPRSKCCNAAALNNSSGNPEYPFWLTPKATEDLDSIWWFIARDSKQSADRVELEIVSACRRIAQHPLMGIRRRDLTGLALRFWTVSKFPNYVIVYRPDTNPLQVIAFCTESLI